jgi:hypothetical protein
MSYVARDVYVLKGRLAKGLKAVREQTCSWIRVRTESASTKGPRGRSAIPLSLSAAGVHNFERWAPPTGVTTDMFSAEEYGSGSRQPPLADAPARVKAKGRPETGEDDRATLTPHDRAFLDSEPAYGEGESMLASLPPPALPAPSLMRRAMSLMLFVTIAGGASAVLILAVLRMLGKSVLP